MRLALFTSTFCCFSPSCYCSATLILNHFHQLLTCPWLQAKPVSILQAAAACLCILPRSQRWLTWRCKHPYRWVWNDFSHNDFCILFIHHESGPEKKINIHQPPSSFSTGAICLYKIHPHVLNRQTHNVAAMIWDFHGDSCSRRERREEKGVRASKLSRLILCAETCSDFSACPPNVSVGAN